MIATFRLHKEIPYEKENTGPLPRKIQEKGKEGTSGETGRPGGAHSP